MISGNVALGIKARGGGEGAVSPLGRRIWVTPFSRYRYTAPFGVARIPWKGRMRSRPGERGGLSIPSPSG